MNREILDWYRTNARRLPWRTEHRDPYHVVVSEFMLQQTQVDRVVPRFEAFVKAFPSIGDLAAASEEDVLGAWSGLGYYRRARLLHQLSKAVSESGGALPESSAELQELPGIGPYTAAAVASLAFGESVPVLDGNVLRVGARVLAMDLDPRSAGGRRQLEEWVRTLLEGAPPGEVNEALMELGATVCTPTDPSCPVCPLAAGCRARAEGNPESYPPPRRRRATVELRWAAACCINREGRLLVKRVDEGPILRGLWLPPLVEVGEGGDPEAAARCLLRGISGAAASVGPAIRHHITHRKIDVVPIRFDFEAADPPADGWQWIDPEDPGVPTSSLLAKLIAAISPLVSE